MVFFTRHPGLALLLCVLAGPTPVLGRSLGEISLSGDFLNRHDVRLDMAEMGVKRLIHKFQVAGEDANRRKLGLTADSRTKNKKSPIRGRGGRAAAGRALKGKKSEGKGGKGKKSEAPSTAPSDAPSASPAPSPLPTSSPMPTGEFELPLEGFSIILNDMVALGDDATFEDVDKMVLSLQDLVISLTDRVFATINKVIEFIEQFYAGFDELLTCFQPNKIQDCVSGTLQEFFSFILDAFGALAADVGQTASQGFCNFVASLCPDGSTVPLNDKAITLENAFKGFVGNPEDTLARVGNIIVSGIKGLIDFVTLVFNSILSFFSDPLTGASGGDIFAPPAIQIDANGFPLIGPGYRTQSLSFLATTTAITKVSEGAADLLEGLSETTCDATPDLSYPVPIPAEQICEFAVALPTYFLQGGQYLLQGGGVLLDLIGNSVDLYNQRVERQFSILSYVYIQPDVVNANDGAARVAAVLKFIDPINDVFAVAV